MFGLTSINNIAVYSFLLLPTIFSPSHALPNLQRRGLPGAVYTCSGENFSGSCGWSPSRPPCEASATSRSRCCRSPDRSRPAGGRRGEHGAQEAFEGAAGYGEGWVQRGADWVQKGYVLLGLFLWSFGRGGAFRSCIPVF